MTRLEELKQNVEKAKARYSMSGAVEDIREVEEEQERLDDWVYMLGQIETVKLDSNLEFSTNHGEKQ